MTTNIYTTPFTLPVGTTTVKYAAVVNGTLTTTNTATYVITNPAFAIDSLTSAATIANIVMSQRNDFTVASMASPATLGAIVLTQGGGRFTIDSMSSASQMDSFALGENQYFSIDGMSSAATLGNITLELGGGTLQIGNLVSASYLDNFSIKKSTVRLVHLGAGAGGISKDIYGTTRNLRIYHSGQWITPT